MMQNRIPCEKCKERGSCCGITIMPLIFIEKHKDKFQVNGKIEISGNEAAVLTDDMACIFLNRITKECMIYEERPEVCKIFGTIDKLLCPYFKPNGNPWSEARKKQIDREYKKRETALFKKVEVKK